MIVRNLCLGLALVATTPDLASAQSPYAGAGLGPTFVFDLPTGAKSAYRGIYGVVGLEWAGPLGVRLEGTETYGFLWLSADLTYRVGARGAPVQPYALAGAGVRLDVDNSDPHGTAGAGVRVKVSRPLSLFGEARLSRVFSSQPIGSFPPRTFLLFALGVAVAPQ